jgi:hypothetical protein
MRGRPAERVWAGSAAHSPSEMRGLLSHQRLGALWHRLLRQQSFGAGFIVLMAHLQSEMRALLGNSVAARKLGLQTEQLGKWRALLGSRNMIVFY